MPICIFPLETNRQTIPCNVWVVKHCHPYQYQKLFNTLVVTLSDYLAFLRILCYCELVAFPIYNPHYFILSFDYKITLLQIGKGSS